MKVWITSRVAGAQLKENEVRRLAGSKNENALQGAN